MVQEFKELRSDENDPLFDKNGRKAARDLVQFVSLVQFVLSLCSLFLVN